MSSGEETVDDESMWLLMLGGLLIEVAYEFKMVVLILALHGIVLLFATVVVKVSLFVKLTKLLLWSLVAENRLVFIELLKSVSEDCKV